ncbi:MAG: DUF971 domain-containing protein [Chthoniobacterales bacterium]|nr:DUF971 domain-containing protein [Chthoniobacterales bacterium]
MQQTFHPTSVQKIGGELAIAWSDGSESFLPLESLRRKCPCAACEGEPDVTGFVEKPVKVFGTGSFDLLSWQMVGGYAIQPHWGDGHNTGLYTYAFLKSLG